jgi:hypothetical protein
MNGDPFAEGNEGISGPISPAGYTRMDAVAEAIPGSLEPIPRSLAIRIGQACQPITLGFGSPVIHSLCGRRPSGRGLQLVHVRSFRSLLDDADRMDACLQNPYRPVEELLEPPDGLQALSKRGDELSSQ